MAHDHYTSTALDPHCDLCQLAQAMRPLTTSAAPDPNYVAEAIDEHRSEYTKDEGRAPSRLELANYLNERGMEEEDTGSLDLARVLYAAAQQVQGTAQEPTLAEQYDLAYGDPSTYR